MAEPDQSLDYVRENGFSTSAGYRDGVPKRRDPDFMQILSHSCCPRHTPFC